MRARVLPRTQIPYLLARRTLATNSFPPNKPTMAVKFPDPDAWPAARVRSTFIDYFVKDKDHTFWKSGSVIPYEDRELLLA